MCPCLFGFFGADKGETQVFFLLKTKIVSARTSSFVDVDVIMTIKDSLHVFLSSRNQKITEIVRSQKGNYSPMGRGDGP